MMSRSVRELSLVLHGALAQACHAFNVRALRLAVRLGCQTPADEQCVVLLVGGEAPAGQAGGAAVYLSQELGGLLVGW